MPPRGVRKGSKRARKSGGARKAAARKKTGARKSAGSRKRASRARARKSSARGGSRKRVVASRKKTAARRKKTAVASRTGSPGAAIMGGSEPAREALTGPGDDLLAGAEDLGDIESVAGEDLED